MPVPFAVLKQHRVHRHPILHKFLLLLVCVLFSALVLFKSVTCDQVTLSKCIFKCYLFIYFFFGSYVFISLQVLPSPNRYFSYLKYSSHCFLFLPRLFCDIIPKHFSYMVPVMWEKYTMPFPLYVNPVHENTTVVTPL